MSTLRRFSRRTARERADKRREEQPRSNYRPNHVAKEFALPLFVYMGHDAPGSAEKRPELRPAHLDHIGALSRAGRVPFAGPLLAEDGSPKGSVIVVEADDYASAREIAEADPYLEGGVFERVDVFETKQVFPEEA